jgi:predicted nucleotidyltransferase
VVSVVEEKLSEVAELCRRFGVERLAVFGSAARDSFDPEKSDIDFVVSLANREPTASYADRYLGLADALEDLLGRRVDLVTEESIRNPHFRREVEASRRPIYGR